ncbi:MAG: DUF1571 domain-containing protein [Planctomycetaceae bacterium]|jgi:hypothetical protein|nr:DUF1571 domain-containing protein [Planctomycetaceae bacterium]
MKKGLVLVSGIAVCLLFSGVSAVCQTSPALSSSAETPKVANVPAAAVSEHPLMPVIRWAERERPNIAEIRDYTALMQKQENINGKVYGAQVMEVKVRHQPFSVYTKFRFPQELNGQQAIYVEGKNNGRLIAHGVGFQRKLGTQKLVPDGLIAMNGNKYPITDMGILNILDKLLEVGYADAKFGECDVTYEDAKTGSKESPRECTKITIVHPVPRQNFRFHVAQIYVDKELNMPIRYESYDWARKAGETPVLLEIYAYRDLKLNVGLTDADFDPKNPEYDFP